MLPVEPIVSEAGSALGCSPLELSLGVSVDFRLLFSVNPANKEKVCSLFQTNHWPLFRIGELIETHSPPDAFLDSGKQITPRPTANID